MFSIVILCIGLIDFGIAIYQRYASDGDNQSVGYAAHLVSILSTFYTKLLHAKIPKSAKKKTDILAVFFALLGSVYVKASRKMLVKLTLGLSILLKPSKANCFSKLSHFLMTKSTINTVD